MAIRNSGGVNKKLETSARILLVDDNANGLSARKSVLEELGYHIQTASSGAEALATFQSGCTNNSFHLVVTDYKMPRMDGLELIRHLREQAPDIAIIMISGYTDALGMDEKSTGADAVIQKSSHEVSHLVRAVSRLLKQRPAGKARPYKANPDNANLLKSGLPAKKPVAAAPAPLARAKSQGS